MRLLSLMMSGVVAVIAIAIVSLAGPGVALANFHCMRIHAVMAGFDGNAKIQYVELRMDAGGQNFVGGHTMKFFDGSGLLKATFTFPASMPANASTGDSILIATTEFNANVTGGMADFVFTNTNTTASNGGDAMHPIQGTNGKVEF